MTHNSLTGGLGRAEFIRSVFRPRPVTQGMTHMSCEVVFGSPSANCMGTGVCKISAANGPLPGMRQQNCRSVTAVLVPIGKGEGVSLVMAREMMCIKLLRSQFKGGFLELNEPCRLPDEITRPLGLKMKTFRAGRYQLEELEGFFRINFL